MNSEWVWIFFSVGRCSESSQQHRCNMFFSFFYLFIQHLLVQSCIFFHSFGGLVVHAPKNFRVIYCSICGTLNRCTCRSQRSWSEISAHTQRAQESKTTDKATVTVTVTQPYPESRQFIRNGVHEMQSIFDLCIQFDISNNLCSGFFGFRLIFM